MTTALLLRRLWRVYQSRRRSYSFGHLPFRQWVTNGWGQIALDNYRRLRVHRIEHDGRTLILQDIGQFEALLRAALLFDLPPGREHELVITPLPDYRPIPSDLAVIAANPPHRNQILEPGTTGDLFD